MYPIAPSMLRNLETEYESVLKTTLPISCSLFSSFSSFSPPDLSSKWVLLGRKMVQWSVRGSEISAADWSSVCLQSAIAATTSARHLSAAAASPQSQPGPSCMFLVNNPQLNLAHSSWAYIIQILHQLANPMLREHFIAILYFSNGADVVI